MNTTENDARMEQFVRESGALAELQMLALRANLTSLAGEQGLQLLWLRHDRHPVVQFLFYVGNENEASIRLRCREIVSSLLRSAGVSVRRDRVFARYGQSIIWCAVVLEG